MTLLHVEDLSVTFRYRDQMVTPLDSVKLAVGVGESVGIDVLLQNVVRLNRRVRYPVPCFDSI